MGCRTGFYFLLRDNVSRAEALRLVQESFAFIEAFEGGDSGQPPREECGNYLENDLPGAKGRRGGYKVLADWSPEDGLRSVIPQKNG